MTGACVCVAMRTLTLARRCSTHMNMLMSAPPLFLTIVFLCSSLSPACTAFVPESRLHTRVRRVTCVGATLCCLSGVQPDPIRPESSPVLPPAVGLDSRPLVWPFRSASGPVQPSLKLWSIFPPCPMSPVNEWRTDAAKNYMPSSSM